MPCPICNKKATKPPRGCRVRYCWCGGCNHCHFGGFCPDGKFWYSQKKGKKDDRTKRHPQQSHGGHTYVPGCNNH